jgi:hypothetical protein
MSRLSTIAVFGDQAFEDELRTALPGFDFIHALAAKNIRALMKGRTVGLVAGRFPLGSFNSTAFRAIARDSVQYGVPALFLAHSPKQAYETLHRSISEPNVGVAYRSEEIRPMMNLLRERLRIQVGEAALPPVPEVSTNLAGHPLIAQGTAFLRAKKTGRLDVKKVADLYDEDVKRFADALGVSQAAVSQTPDSKKYQGLLGYFEAAARIIPLLESKGGFAAWAKTPNRELKGEAPVDLLFGGAARAQELVEIVEDVLVGQPD